MTAPTLYLSTDTSAPTVTGLSAGGLIPLLDACLVNGYGSKTAAGWAKSFSGTNLASYRPPAGNRFYLNVDDNPAAGTNHSRWRGFEVATAAGPALANGTGPFPTDTDLSGGEFTMRSSATTSTARLWLVLANDRSVLVLVSSGQSSSTNYDTGMFWGDFLSFTAESYNSCSIGDNSINVAEVSCNLVNCDATLVNSGPSFPCYPPRIAAGTGASLKTCKTGAQNYNGSNTIYATGGFAYPGPIGGIILAPVLIGNGPTTTMPRGQLPFLWATLSKNTDMTSAGVASGDTFSGATSGVLAGRTFLLVKWGSAPYWLALETSAPAAITI